MHWPSDPEMQFCMGFAVFLVVMGCLIMLGLAFVPSHADKLLEACRAIAQSGEDLAACLEAK